MGANADVDGIGVRKKSGVLVGISKRIGDVEISKKTGEVERVGEGRGVVSDVIATESDVNVARVGMEVMDGEIALLVAALADSVGVDTSELVSIN